MKNRWKTCGCNGLTWANEIDSLVKLRGRPNRSSNGSAGLKARRSGGNANRSLKTRLNVPVVRWKSWVKIRAISQDRPSGLRIAMVAITSFRAMEMASLSTTRRQTTGYKREFDPGSESTLAACLTHASRTRKSARMSTVAYG